MFKLLKKISRRAYSFGNPDDIENHLRKKYKKEPILLEFNEIDLAEFTARSLEVGAGNCTLVAMVRSVEYLKNSKGLEKIPADRKQIYADSKKIAKKYLYTDKYGTLPALAGNIYESIFLNYGYNAYSKGYFIWDFYDNVVREIDLGYPVIFNIARGYYKNHSITISGYRIYRLGRQNIKIAIIHDSWRKSVRYLNFSQLERNILLAGLGSFNNIRIVI